MADIDRDRIELCKSNYLKGKKFPPVLALLNGKVIDGAHRVVAAREMHVFIEVVYINAPISYVDPEDLKIWLDTDS